MERVPKERRLLVSGDAITLLVQAEGVIEISKEESHTATADAAIFSSELIIAER